MVIAILGLLSAVPRALGIAAPRDIFNSSQLHSLIAQARANLNDTATEFSNGNPKLAKGIMAQLNIALKLYESGKELPLEMNLGEYNTSLMYFSHNDNITEPGYAGIIIP
jgi:hypothetical protein